MRRRERDPATLLHGLLDRFEKIPDRQRAVTARPSLIFADSDEKQRLESTLRAAAMSGAVALVADRDAPHLIGMVRLVAPSELYRHLGREPRDEQAARAHAAVAAITLESAQAERLRDWLLATWRQGSSAAGLAPHDQASAILLLRAADAAFAPDILPLRARSARLLGDSKALERSLGRLFTALREAGMYASAISDEELRQELGLERVPPIVTVAGPLRIAGQSIAAWTMAGIAPEQIEQITFDQLPRTVLTIENLESFHRHVREARTAQDVVIFSGGYPSRSVIALLRHLKALGVEKLYHWGDVDPAGLRIAELLALRSGLALALHLMTPELTALHGRPMAKAARHLTLAAGGATAALASYLSGDTAHQLEQEIIDPQPVDP